MKQEISLKHKFVEYIPNVIDPWTIYVSIEFSVAAHKCCCGCGNEVVTPLSPTDWKLIFDGRTISLYPSIGNWSFACQSHYWISGDTVKWAPRMSSNEIRAGRIQDIMAKEQYFKSGTQSTSTAKTEEGEKQKNETLFQKLKKWMKISWK